MTIFLCDGSPEGIFCGIYDAWMSGLGHGGVRLGLTDQGNRELFCDYREVPVIREKAEKVTVSIRTKISERAFEKVFKATLSRDEDRADKIYRFLILGFRFGESVLNMLQSPAVYDLFRMCRFIDNETHLLTEFLRFSAMEGGLLYSRIGPKNDILVLLAPHFADRLPGENWVICDENRRKAVLHPAGKTWIVADNISEKWREHLICSECEKEYRVLWKAFRKSVSIAERENDVCQRGHMPLRYRRYMTEFGDKLRDIPDKLQDWNYKL